MKKLIFAMFFLVLLFGSFMGGAWYSQFAGKKQEGARRILNYVDPMNPVNVSDKPGIAPCGMPMEPVYGDEESAEQGPSDAVLTKSPGTVKITAQKQQIIGVRIGTAERMQGTYEFRTLGRITPDENRVYPLIAATDGWLEDIHGNTTGSLVKKDQLMAQIKIYSYDFFTWQQRYLAELANRGQRRHPATPPEARQPGGALQPGVPQTAAPQSGSAQPDGTPDASPQNEPQSETRPPKGRLPSLTLGLTKQLVRDPLDDRADAALYANKSELELLNLGAGEAQLVELARTAKYLSTIELRSPANGLVISRSISSHQRVDRGTECFKVADLSRVWIIADVFNTEAPSIRPGIRARISLPGQTKYYEARVSDVLPKFDTATRTLKVRLEMDNPKNVLLPEMFVDVEFLIPLPLATTVPASAILDSGRKKIAFVALGDGVFEPRTVTTGWRSGDRVEIIEGLMPGEQIVISGNFLIDSESRMKLAAAGLSGKPENDPSGKTPQGLTNKTSEGNAAKSAPNPAEHKHD